MNQMVYRYVHDTTSMIRPPYLQQGDKVGIISSAKRTTPEEIQYGIHLLQGWGLEPVPGKHVFSEHHFLRVRMRKEQKICSRCSMTIP